MINAKDVLEMRKLMTECQEKLSAMYTNDADILELMASRKYYDQYYFDEFKKLGVFKINSILELNMALPDVLDEDLVKMGFVNAKGNYILRDRYVVPIRDIQGHVIAWVGWHPRGGSRKYVTTPSLGFSRDASFFNLDHAYKLSWSKFRGKVFLVEGIYDAVALRAMGLPVVAAMGLSVTWLKAQILSRFAKVAAIPDNDKAGRSVSPILNSFSGKGRKFIWDIPTPTVFVMLPEGMKDIDKFASEYDIYNDLLSCFDASVIKKLKLDDDVVVESSGVHISDEIKKDIDELE